MNTCIGDDRCPAESNAQRVKARVCLSPFYKRRVGALEYLDRIKAPGFIFLVSHSVERHLILTSMHNGGNFEVFRSGLMTHRCRMCYLF